MTSTFLSLEIGKSALQATSLGVETTGHNIANANTPGYSREVADLETETSLVFFSDHQNFLGQGVNARGQNRVVDEALNSQYRTNNAQQSYYQTYSTEVGSVSKVFNEPQGTTLRQSIDAFFTAWNTLAGTPADDGARSAVYEASQQLTDAFHNTSNALQQDITRYGKELSDAVDEVNQLATSIAGLNAQIMKAKAAGSPPNDLLDQRDALLDKLSRYASITVTNQDDGSVTVQLDGNGSTGYNLVSKDKVTNVLGVTVNATGPDSQNPATVAVSSLKGKAGQLTSLNDMVNYTQGVAGEVDTLAQDLAKDVNKQYDQGYDKNGNSPNAADASGNTPNKDLFWSDASSKNAPPAGTITAANIAVNPNLTATTLDSIPAGSTAPTTDNTVSPPATEKYQTDGGNADVIGQMVGDLDGEYAAIVTKLGVDGQAANQQNQTFTALTTQVSQMRTSVTGVNINDEMANMVQFQQSYGAASKFISVFNDMLTTLIQSV